MSAFVLVVAFALFVPFAAWALQLRINNRAQKLGTPTSPVSRAMGTRGKATTIVAARGTETPTAPQQRAFEKPFPKIVMRSLRRRIENPHDGLPAACAFFNY